MLKALRLKFEASMEEERMCILSFDGMAINRALHYTKGDNIIGFEELGDERRTNSVAGEMLVFMIRGLSAQWKQVIHAYVSSALSKQGFVKA